mmetsp:Transcript_52375/g.132374  ORF Transcript_52375/g.132374 Transcript_52375/m.132374 type:complete len:200 (-) Transcript_52375:137-736(-)
MSRVQGAKTIGNCSSMHPLQRCDILAKVAEKGSPDAKHVVTGEHGLLLNVNQHHVVVRVARRVQHPQRGALRAEGLAVAQRREALARPHREGVDCALASEDVLRRLRHELPHGHVRAVAGDHGGDPPEVVVVPVSDDDLLQPGGAEALHGSLEVRQVLRLTLAGVNQDTFRACADEVRVRPRQREGPRIHAEHGVHGPR